MHKRKEIIANQSQFREEIIDGLKKEFKLLKKEISKINSKDPAILAGKSSLNKKAEKINVTEEINRLFISWKNVNPVFYAWWDTEGEQVVKIKYIYV